MDAEWWTETGRGRWTANALRRLKETEPVLAWSGIERKQVATIAGLRGSVAYVAKHGRNWSAKIDGFEWRVTPEMRAAKFGLKFVDVAIFPSRKSAETAVAEVVSSACAPDPRPPSP